MDSGRIGGIRNFVRSRSSALRNQLRRATSSVIDFEITTNSGDGFETQDPAVTIEGNAPIEVWTVLVSVNGRPLEEPARFSNSAPLDWLVNVPLEAGANQVQCLAFDNAGGLVGTDEITVTTAFDAPPVIERIEPDAAEPGQLVSIHGTNFHAGVTVTFGDIEAEVDAAGVPSRLDVVVPDELGVGEWNVVVHSAQTGDSNAMTLTVLAAPAQFVRGDTSLNGRLELADAVATLSYLFAQQTIACRDAADYDDDGRILLTDAVRIIDLLFRRGPAPAAPYPDPGRDETPDDLDCETGI